MNSTNCESYEACANSIRKSPVTAVGIAFLAGLIFRILPVTAIVAALVRTTAALVRPALLVLGVTKAVELFRR